MRLKLTKVTIRNFKRFDDVTFELPDDGSVVIAGPNNAGKTTLLQAIATWGLALNSWLELDDRNERNGYVRVPITRQVFYSVPLLKFADLWNGANSREDNPIQITLFFKSLIGNELFFPIEICYDTSEQIYARPINAETWKEYFDAYDFGSERAVSLSKVVFIPAMTGIATEEAYYHRPMVQHFLGQGKPGEVLRNLLAETFKYQDSWNFLHATVKDLFGYNLLPPNTNRAYIRAEYEHNGLKLDISSAGSGFLQVLMLLSFLTVNKNAILLLDEPDAHLHILLQDRIYKKLQDLASRGESTLIIATHSERIINTTELGELCVLLDKPKRIVTKDEKKAVVTALTTIDNTDLMLAQPGEGLFTSYSGKILYVEGYTDINILSAWARVLGHPLLQFLEQPFWKPTVLENQGGEIKSDRHFDALRLANPEIIGVELRDSDGFEKRSALNELYQLSNNLYRFFWGRYEIESYLIHPESIAKFVLDWTGQQEAADKAINFMKRRIPLEVLENPLGDDDYLKNTKAKTLLSDTFREAGVHLSDYSQLAITMSRDTIHPEVVAKLDAIAEKFDLM